MSVSDRKRTTLQRFSLASDGVAAIEFALTVPLLLLLIFGALQVSLGFFTGHKVQYAIEQTAREMLLGAGTTQEELQVAIDARLARMGAAPDLSVSLTTDNSRSIPIATVEAEYVHVVSIPLVPEFEMRFPVEVTIPQAGS